MVKSSLGLLVLLSVVAMTNASAADCKKSLMGSECVKQEKGTSSHMRGNAVANAKAGKALKAVQEKAKAKAKAVAIKNKK